ncbi:hypothetical protein EDM80_09070 [bacterium]|nr:MAG: hypothetical protein EDM80_09070 [bacterium]
MLELLWSFTFRPYVTLFLLAFLAMSWLEQGWLRTILWMVSGYLVAFVAEYCSTQVNGIPFGWYVYNYEALSNDLVIAGVPFFDSLSFSFLSYVSFSFAQFFMSSLWRQGLDVQRVTPRRVRNSAFVLFLGAVLMVVIDLITGWIIIFINQRIDALLVAGAGRGQVTLRHVKFKGLFAPLFWAGIVLFQLGVTYWVAFSGVIEPEATTMGEANLTVIVRAQAISGTFVIVPILLLALAHLLRRGSEASPAEISEWLEEFPCERLKQRLI